MVETYSSNLHQPNEDEIQLLRLKLEEAQCKNRVIQEEMNNLKSTLSDDISAKCYEEAIKITGSVVKAAAGQLKPAKNDVSGSYSSDALLCSPDLVFENLAIVYRSWLIHGTVTPHVLSCDFLPLYKGGLKDPASTDSYRAIACSSLLLKQFDNIVLYLWGHLLSMYTLQFGFKAGTSTTECSWLVMEVSNYFLRNRTPVIATLLDCTKAFDTCKFSTLFSKLYKRKVPPIVIRTLMHIYEEQVAWVKWGNSQSESFGVVNGTRQGSVLSPCLFSVYIDELLSELRKLGVGCHIGGVFLGAFGYADDILLLAPSRSATMQMLNVCEKFGRDNNFHH